MAVVERDFKRVEGQIPFAKWQYVDVTFAAPDTDTPIPHTIRGVEPELIRWVPLATEGDVYVYRAPQGTRLEWTSSVIWLRASAAATVRLLLASEIPL